MFFFAKQGKNRELGSRKISVRKFMRDDKSEPEIRLQADYL